GQTADARRFRTKGGRTDSFGTHAFARTSAVSVLVRGGAPGSARSKAVFFDQKVEDRSDKRKDENDRQPGQRDADREATLENAQGETEPNDEVGKEDKVGDPVEFVHRLRNSQFGWASFQNAIARLHLTPLRIYVTLIPGVTALTREMAMN